MSHPVQRRWYLPASAIAALVVLPLSVLLLSWQQVDTVIWAHLWQTQLPRLLGNTLQLLLGVGCGVVLRHPHKIRIGDNVVIDDYCVLDAKGQTNQGIVIDRGVFIGRNTILSCKNGDIHLHDGANLGFNCEIFSGGAKVVVGRNVMLAAYSYLIGGGHEATTTDVSPLEQARTATGITVGDGAWIGAGVLVLDGANLGQQAIVGAGAVVTKSVDDFAVVAGVPARFVRSRK